MLNILKVLAISALLAVGGLVVGPQASAQAAECEVSGDYGSFSINEANNTVTGRFSIHGPQGCTPTQVSIAVWSCADDCSNLQAQRFEGGASGNFSHAGASTTNQAFPTHTITTNLPDDEDRCTLQIDLVRGGQRADPSHPFPDGPFYDGRRMSAIVIENPACEEVTEVEVPVEVPVEVIREVPVEVVREVEVEREVVREVEVPAEGELPNTGPASAAATLVGTGALVQSVRMYVGSRRKLLASLLNR